MSPAIYAEPLICAAYLLRHFGPYTLQLGDVLTALCGGPCPEAVSLAALHSQLGGLQLDAMVVDLNAATWCDCWPISEDIVRHYPQHPAVRIQGLTINLLDGLPA